jgi:2-oxoglutarate ferredoxin oxidoreductase subunit alpha
MAYEAARIAMKYMTPVILLTDGYIANGSEPWLIPNPDTLEPIVPPMAKVGESYLPYERDEKTMARRWALPGTPGLEHRIGGLEKAQKTGLVSHDPENHHSMTVQRHRKISGIAADIPLQTVEGNKSASTLVVSWGGTYGAVSNAVEECNKHGLAIAHAHLRYMNPFPSNLGSLLKKYKTIIIPELNVGQLRLLLCGTFGIPALGVNMVRGKPFKVTTLVEEFHALAEINS